MDDDSKNYLINKVDRIHDDIVEIKITLAKAETNIDYHIKRTDLAEHRTDLLEEKVDLLKEEIMKNKTIKDFLMFVTKISPILAALGGAWAKFKHLF